MKYLGESLDQGVSDRISAPSFCCSSQPSAIAPTVPKPAHAPVETVNPASLLSPLLRKISLPDVISLLALVRILVLVRTISAGKDIKLPTGSSLRALIPGGTLS